MVYYNSRFTTDNWTVYLRQARDRNLYLVHLEVQDFGTVVGRKVQSEVSPTDRPTMVLLKG